VGRLLTETRKDRLATVLIRTGGLLVILIVVGIVVDIGLEAVPLFLGARAGALEPVACEVPPLAAGSDPRREILWEVGPDAVVRFPLGPDTEPLLPFTEPTPLTAADHEIGGLLTLLADDGRVAVGRVRFRDDWSGGDRHTVASWRPAAPTLAPPAGVRFVGAAANAGDDGLLLAAWAADGALHLARWEGDDQAWSTAAITVPGPVRVAAVAEGLGSVALVLADGRLLVLDGHSHAPVAVESGLEPIARARFLIGGGTLIAAASSGAMYALLEVPRAEVTNHGSSAVQIDGIRLGPGEQAVVADTELGAKLAARPEVAVVRAPPVWQVARELPELGSEPTVIAPGSRRRDLLVGGADGTVALYHSTSGRRLLRHHWGEGPVTALALDPKGDGDVAVVGGSLLRRTISNPHPETTLRTLFLPTWYEGYAAPAWVWQSTGGSDASEPKLSLWPLLFGTLKATLYAMLISVPLALAAAVYISQLAPTWVQTVVKPTLELMAAVPSVVVGFLAALWLAPRLEQALLLVLLGGLGLPTAVVVALALWRLIPGRRRRRLPEGSEAGVLLVAVVAVLGTAALLAEPLEAALFGGDLRRFLFTDWGLRYDQRNAIAVGIGLGFAVIPVIFTIAEDACTAVPRSLVAAARALGATRWQTAARLVVPAASPGLFAAVMLGLGRAVGETMIVLMAAGNTPLLDLSPFNGMRTMSAAIAVEMPEAPVEGTLFRVLFLTGTLLFLLTLVLTTFADLVGRRLRERYGRF